MLKFKSYEACVVEETKKHIHKILPNNQRVDIKISLNRYGHYECLILVQPPHAKLMVALKSDPTLKGSVDKSFKAIIKQIDKLKGKWEGYRTPLMFAQESA